MDNFIDVLAAARLGQEDSTTSILKMFEDNINVLSKGNEDLKSGLTLEALEQIIGKRANTFNVSRLISSFKQSDSAQNHEGWNKYIQNKFVLWTGLHLSRLTKKLTGKAKLTVYIPWYVATATKHYNRLLSYFGSHKEVVSFIEGRIKQETIPKYLVQSKEVLSNSLKTRGRKNLLDRVRLLVSEIPFDLGIHDTVAKPEQEFRMMTKEFVLDRPCNINIKDKVKQAAMYRLEGKIDLSIEHKLVDQCSQQLTKLNNYRCEESKCVSYSKCCTEWEDLEKEMVRND